MEFSSIALPTAYAANLASLPRLPINTSYASSTSINISDLNSARQERRNLYHLLTRYYIQWCDELFSMHFTVFLKGVE